MKNCILILLFHLLSLSGSSQINANFTTNSNNLCVPGYAFFNDLSTGSITSWHWDFGDGNTSNIQNPSYVYSQPGSYTVSLVVSDGNVSDTIIFIDYINIIAIPLADFIYQISSPLTVSFTNTSNPIGSSQWDLGDQSFSFMVNVLHTYANSGNYLVCLLNTDSYGCQGSVCKDIDATQITGVEDHVQEKAALAFPNPTNGLVNIDLTGLKDVSFKVFDVTGKMVFFDDNIDVSDSSYMFELEEKKGLYIIEMYSEGSIKRIKLIKE
jgi:PKD repeat protein